MKKNYVIALTAALLLAACGQKQEDNGTTIRPVKTAIVESRSEINKDFSGIVEAVDYVKLAFRVSGQTSHRRRESKKRTVDSCH